VETLKSAGFELSPGSLNEMIARNGRGEQEASPGFELGDNGFANRGQPTPNAWDFQHFRNSLPPERSTQRRNSRRPRS
jgi:hypothetical protein